MILELIIGFALGFAIAKFNYQYNEEAREIAMKEFAQDLAWKNTKAERMEALEKMDRIAKFYDRKEQEFVDDIEKKLKQ